MKRILAILLIIVMAFSLSACHKHRWEEANCENPKTCSICGKTKGDPLGHNWGEPSYEWADDMSSVTASRVCKNDPSHVESETVDTVVEELRAATCTESGESSFSAEFENPVFGAQSRTEELPAALGHAWGEPIYEWADDLSSVTATRICENDPSHAETEIAEVTAEVTRPATCEEPGETTYTALFGNEGFTAQSRTEANIEATGHVWGEPSYEWADDLSSVTAIRVCENDPSHVDSETASVSVEALTDENGQRTGEAVYSAAFENSVFAVQSRTAPDSEEWYAWSEPSYEWADDMSSVTVSRVSGTDPSLVETETAEVTAEVTRPATCEEPGETTYSVVFADGSFPAQSRTEADIAPLGHAWGEPSYEWADDMSSVTASCVCANDPSHVESETASVTAEVKRPATCEEPGETTYTAAFENPAFAAQSRTEADPEALGHAWGEPSYEWADDMNSVTASRVCANDPSHVESETASVTAEVTRPATCEEPGETTYTAVFENPAFEVQSRTETDIEALGHSWLKATHTQPATCSVCGETEGEPLPIHYFDVSFKEYRHLFNRSYPAFLSIEPGRKGYELHVKGDTMTANGLDKTIRFYHADEFYPGSRSSKDQLKRFNLIEITYVSDSKKFDTSISARVAQMGYYAAKILDPGLGQTAFFKNGLDLFDAKGNEQSFTHNGFVYTLSCTQDGGSYRYVFRMTLEDNLE